MKTCAFVLIAMAVSSTPSFAAQPAPKGASGESLQVQCMKWSYGRVAADTKGTNALQRRAEIQRCVAAGGPSQM
jgi:hypothetical protein